MSLSRMRWEVFSRDGYRCMECLLAPPDVALVIDHILPRHFGGPTLHFNLQTLCEECNNRKSDTLIFDEFPLYGDKLERHEWFQRKWEEYAELREAELAVLVNRELEGV